MGSYSDGGSIDLCARDEGEIGGMIGVKEVHFTFTFVVGGYAEWNDLEFVESRGHRQHLGAGVMRGEFWGHR